MENKTFATSGFPVVADRKYYLFGKYNKVYVYPDHEHTIIFGGSGSGKTQTVVYPLIQSILDARENAVIHDCKLEIVEHYGKKFKEAGYNVIVLNYSNPKYSNRWNPFDYPIKKWKEALDKNGKTHSEFRECRSKGLAEPIENIKDICSILCYEEDNDRNSFFWKGAGNMMAGAVLLMAEEGRYDCINGKGIRMLFKQEKSDDKNKFHNLKAFLDTQRNMDDDSVIQLSVFLGADGITRGNISATFEQKVEILGSTPDIQYLTSASDFDMRDIFEKQTVVFILTQDEKDIYYPLVTVFLKQLYEVGVKLTRDGKYKKWPYRMNWILEEMGILTEIKNVKNIYNAARSRGLTIYGFMQSMADMEDKYEPNGARTILENCRCQIYVHGETDETNKYFIKRCGKEIYKNKHRKKGEPKYLERDILNPDRLQMLEKGRILITIAGQDPYFAKLPPYTDYTFYEEPDIAILKKDYFFGENGRSYEYSDVDNWLHLKETLEMNEFINSKQKRKKSISKDKKKKAEDNVQTDIFNIDIYNAKAGVVDL